MKSLIAVLLLSTLPYVCFSFDRKPFNFDDEHITHEVFFNTDEFTLSTEESEKLTAFINQIKNIDIERISILGFCDDRGSESYNQDLSNKRAKAVKKIIEDFKINQYLITSVNGEGEVELTTQEEELFNKLRTLNRKVIIVVAPRKLVAGSFFADDLYPGETFNIENLHFKRGLRYLNDDSISILNDLADFLVKRKDIYFTIQGHVCCTSYGMDSRDKETGIRNLSIIRAKYIHDYLVKRGVESYRIEYEGLAGRYNLGRSEEEDRRVEILIRRINGMAEYAIN